MGYRPPRSYYYHLSGAQLRGIDEAARVGKSLMMMGRRYGLTGVQVSTALMRYRAQERLRRGLPRWPTPLLHVGSHTLAPDRSGQVTT